MQERIKLGYVKIVSYALYVFSAACILWGFAWRPAFLIALGCFVLSAVVDLKLYVCPYCKTHLDVRISGDDDFFCKHCGKHI